MIHFFLKYVEIHEALNLSIDMNKLEFDTNL
ncbi:hypothetical protein SAMN05421796_10648 [Chryseobacterium piscicola]|uniref:Uncharacterized protein n=1 Tax=Chryseobacterium piscicola TaxID=551459 RepID=A0A1N7MYY5_9FLAO|nr:hypothetical protein SAMN05421796_10648 [Chryseobacterium piscicola]